MWPRKRPTPKRHGLSKTPKTTRGGLAAVAGPDALLRAAPTGTPRVTNMGAGTSKGMHGQQVGTVGRPKRASTSQSVKSTFNRASKGAVRPLGKAVSPTPLLYHGTSHQGRKEMTVGQLKVLAAPKPVLNTFTRASLASPPCTPPDVVMTAHAIPNKHIEHSVTHVPAARERQGTVAEELGGGGGFLAPQNGDSHCPLNACLMSLIPTGFFHNVLKQHPTYCEHPASESCLVCLLIDFLKGVCTPNMQANASKLRKALAEYCPGLKPGGFSELSTAYQSLDA